MKQIMQAATIAIHGMEANLNKPGGAWLTYKHAYLQCLDDLQDIGMSEEEAKKHLQKLMS